MSVTYVARHYWEAVRSLTPECPYHHKLPVTIVHAALSWLASGRGPVARKARVKMTEFGFTEVPCITRPCDSEGDGAA